MGMKPKVNEAKFNLTRIGKKVSRAIERRALRQSGKILQRNMKGLVPVVTGDLRRSIKVRAGKRSRLKQTVNVVAMAPYAKKIEELYGYAADAREQSLGDISREFHDTIRRELETL